MPNPPPKSDTLRLTEALIARASVSRIPPRRIGTHEPRDRMPFAFEHTHQGGS